MNIRLYFLLLLFPCLVACQSAGQLSEKRWGRETVRYEQATEQVQNMQLPPVDLYAISASNPEAEIRMMSWMTKEAAHSYFQPIGSPDTLDSPYKTWVTVEAELQQKAIEYRLSQKQGAKLALRLDQSLGLPPNPADTGRVFLIMLVKVKDVYRPCPDPEISDERCTEKFAAGAYSQPDTAYQSLFAGIKTETSSFPWTARGYTYDWHPRNRSHVGLSEFIIRRGAIVRIEEKVATADWMNRLN